MHILTTAYYFLQVILCSAVMMGYYWLVLRNKRFHQYNRFYLLAITVLSWIVPLIKIKWGHDVVADNQPQVFQFLNVVAYNNSQIEERISQQNHPFNWEMFAGGAYCIIAGILLLAMSNALLRIYRLLKTHDCKSVGDVYLILTNARGTPFSFFRYIFWNEEIDISSESGKQILQHELTHVKEKHSVDKLMIQLVLVAGWFNPFFWLIKKELNIIHEFIADSKAVKNGDTASFAQMLLMATFPKQQYLLTSPFFFSPIKRRLQMLTNNTSPRFSYVRRIVILPLLAVLVILFSFRDKDQKEHTLSVASVVEGVVEKGKELITVHDMPMNPIIKNDTVIVQADTSEPFSGVVKLGEFSVVDSMVTLGKFMGKLSDTPPLYIVDGMRVPNLYKIRMNDISIIKDSKNLERYGEEGKNGVVLITTKAFAEAEKKSINNKSSSPQPGIQYQAIARDPFNNIAKSRTVFVKIAILHGSKTGDKVWEEAHETKTNEDGIFTIVIGKGERISGIVKSDIDQIDWGEGPYFLSSKIAIAPTIPLSWWRPADFYTDMGTIEMMSVPYSLYANGFAEARRNRQNDSSYESTEGTDRLRSNEGITHVPSYNLNLTVSKGVDLTIPPNTTSITDVSIKGVRKGDPILVTPQLDNAPWSIYSAWVSGDDLVKVRFANYTNKPLNVLGTDYKVVVIK